MYESHFGFKTRPFTATPNTECFFPTENTRRAFESVVSCIDRASGAALIVGGSGLGKSLLLQVIGSHFQQGYSVAILESASITSRRELLQSILFELGLPYRGMEEGELRLTLMDYLKPSDHCPNGLLLCVDEAHLLQTKLLEELKMITNLVRDGRPRARLVLAGNATIEERLTDPKLESLNQRIATRAYLQPMSQNECWNYVESHLARAGRQTQEVFDDNAVEAVHTATNGIPRLVNQVCDHSFVLAIAEGQTRITKETINEAWSDIQRLPVQWHVLGAETESQNDHVIEFGSLGSEDESENADDRLETQFENSYDEVINTDAEITAEEEQEPEKVEFVFTGPENPFTESFEEEEMVVDSFTQVIGHSPLRPTRPIRVTRSESETVAKADPLPEETLQNEVMRDLEHEISVPEPSSEVHVSNLELGDNTDQVAPEQTALEQIDDLEYNQPSSVDLPTFEQTSLKSPNFEAAFGLDPIDEISDSPETTSPESVKGSETSFETASESDNSTTQSISDYLAQSSDGFTFGVGQGIYSSQFPDEENSETTNAAEPSLEENDALTRNDQPEFSSIQAEVESAIESHDGEAIDEINESVESIKQEMQSISMDSVSSTRLDSPEPNHQDRTDDRDMIIVEEEPTPSQTIQSVPMEEVAAPATAPTAKREDYQKLFDRLRKG